MAKPRPRALLRVTAFLVLPAAGLAFWLYLQPKNDPILHSKLSPGMTLIPRSRFSAKPWFSIPWFGGQKVEYPPRGSMPKAWKDDALDSGIFYWKAPPLPVASGSAAMATGPSGLDWGAIYFKSMEWVDPYGRPHILPTDLVVALPAPDFAGCPYVFGDRQVRFNVRFPNREATASVVAPANLPVDFEIELPPLRIPRPDMPAKVVKAGPWHLTFQPIDWMGPSFGARCRVTARGLKPGQTLLVQTDHSKPMAEASLFTSFRLTHGGSATILTSSRSRLRVSLAEERTERMQLTESALPSAPGVGPMSRLNLRNKQGKLVGSGISTRGFRYILPQENVPEAIAFKYNTKWLGYNFPTDATDPIRSISEFQSNIKPGWHDLTVYRSLRTETVEISGILPDVRSLLSSSKER